MADETKTETAPEPGPGPGPKPSSAVAAERDAPPNNGATPSVESQSSTGSSSQTARDDVAPLVTQPHEVAQQRANTNDSGGGIGEGLRATLSSFLPTRSNDSREEGDEGKAGARTDLTMPRTTLNTVPVWARQDRHGRGASKQSPGRSPRSLPSDAHSSSLPRTRNTPMKKPPALHLADSTQAQTAVATRDFAGVRSDNGSVRETAHNNNVQADDDGVDDDDDDESDRQTLSTLSISSVRERDGDDASRFWSFTLPRGSKRRRPIPADMGESDKRNDVASGEDDNSKSPKATDDPATARFSDHFGALTSAVSGVLSGYTSDGHRSYDSDAARQRATHDEDESLDEKQMSGAREGTRGGWSHDSYVDESRAGDEFAGEKKSRDPKPESLPVGLSRGDAFRNRAGLLPDSSFTRNQQLTPGWESPWRPESRSEHSIKFGKYRFNHHGEGGYFPRSDTGARKSDDARRRRNASGNTNILSDPGLVLELDWWRRFLLHNAFVPLLFRMINIGFTTTTLAIAIKLYQILQSEGAEDAVGSSPIVAIIFAPLTLVHVAIQIYIEYFSRPIGLWRVGSKLFYTLIELVFICLWSAELSLSFDNYFTSTLVCTTFNSPYASDPTSNPAYGEQMLNDPSRKPFICRLQGVLIGLVFTSLLAYIVVFAVSLFRIFVRVKR